jgi:cardiolipin synthase A/B
MAYDNGPCHYPGNRRRRRGDCGARDRGPGGDGGPHPEGAIAWALSLIMFPLLVVPLYWIFGRSKFQGYVRARRAGDLEIYHVLQEAARRAYQDGLLRQDLHDDRRVFEQLAKMPFLRSNRVDLLIDGEATFEAMYAGIESARDYILVQSYIVRDDRAGQDPSRV